MAGSNASVGSKHRLVGFNVCLLQSKEVLVDPICEGAQFQFYEISVGYIPCYIFLYCVLKTETLMRPRKVCKELYLLPGAIPLF